MCKINIDMLYSVIPNFNKYVDVKEDLSGHSSAYRYILLDRYNNKYFLKLYKGNRINSLKEIDEIYEKNCVKTAKIQDLGYIDKIDRTYTIYEYIDGRTLLNVARSDEISKSKLDKLGSLVGNELNKFNNIDVRKINLDIEDIEVKLAKLIEDTIKIKEFYDKYSESDMLPYINLDKLFMSVNNLKQYVISQDRIFIHGDINLNNIIVKNDIPYLIDTDGGKISYRVLNFRGNFWHGICSKEDGNERTVYRGIYNQLFENKIPDTFHKQLAFTMIYEFLLRLNRFPENLEQIIYTFSRFKGTFDSTNYFIDYKFDWF